MNKKEIDEFLLSIPEDSEFTREEQKVLAELWYNKPVLTTIMNKVINKLKNKMLKEDLSVEYVRWAKASILWFKSYFKDV